MTTVDASAAETTGLPQGAQVSSVAEGSPAADAGLVGSGSAAGQPVQGGDVITAIDGEAVETAQDLTAAVASHKAGDVVTLVVERDGQRLEVKVTLGSRPS